MATRSRPRRPAWSRPRRAWPLRPASWRAQRRAFGGRRGCGGGGGFASRRGLAGGGGLGGGGGVGRGGGLAGGGGLGGGGGFALDRGRRGGRGLRLGGALGRPPLHRRRRRRLLDHVLARAGPARLDLERGYPRRE